MRHPEIAAQFRVAFELRRTIGELQTMPVSEFVYWLAYLKARDDAISRS